MEMRPDCWIYINFSAHTPLLKALKKSTKARLKITKEQTFEFEKKLYLIMNVNKMSNFTCPLQKDSYQVGPACNIPAGTAKKVIFNEC